jgi:hypothetical protein
MWEPCRPHDDEWIESSAKRDGLMDEIGKGPVIDACDCPASRPQVP